MHTLTLTAHICFHCMFATDQNVYFISPLLIFLFLNSKSTSTKFEAGEKSTTNITCINMYEKHGIEMDKMQPIYFFNNINKSSHAKNHTTELKEYAHSILTHGTATWLRGKERVIGKANRYKMFSMHNTSLVIRLVVLSFYTIFFSSLDK